jgi:CRP-like cAMP-binding protein
MMSDVDDKPPMRRETQALLNRLSRRLALPLPDQEVLFTAASAPRHSVKGDFLIQEGSKTTGLMILCLGMARAVRTLADGTQQIVAIYVAGDMLNAGELLYSRSRTSISALTSSVCLSVPLDHLERVISNSPAVARALWGETAARAAIQQEWMVWLGRRNAQARLAHFLCELGYRLQVCGDDTGDMFDLPLTQHELADILGLSTVHVNRVLQFLRSRKLIELSRNRLTVRDKASLRQIAEFDAQYLSGLQPSDGERTENA